MNLLLLAQENGADVVGFFSFINILWVFVALMFLVAVGGLFGKYAVPLLAEINPPAWVLELGAYCGSVCGMLLGPRFFGPIASFIIALASIPFFSAAVAYRMGVNWRLTLGHIILFTGVGAAIHQSAFFGGISVLVLLWLSGSWFFPLLQENEYDNGQWVPSGFWASACILGVAGFLSFTSNPEWFSVFKPGAFWLAGTVYTGGLMTLSNRYYRGGVGATWVLWQVVAVASGVGAMFLGHTYSSYMGTTVLQEIGGTFLALYMISKIAEIPWDLNYWPWIALGAAVLCYYAVNFAAQHPNFFLGF